MPDFSYANDDAVKATGVLTDHDKTKGWQPGSTDSIIDKITAEIQRHPDKGNISSGYSVDDDPQFTQDEKDAWHWYMDDVVEPGHWKDIVNTYMSDPTKVPPKDYNPDDDYIPKKDSGFKPPSVSEYNGPDNKSHTLSVSTEAIEYFIKELKAVADDGSGILLDARKDLNALNVRPGGFARAEKMRQKIMGANGDDPGLRGDTMNLLTTIHSALFDMQTDLHNMLVEYQNTEDFNKMTAEQFGEVMGDSWTKVGNLSQYGKSSSTGSGSGSDGEKDS